MDNTIDYRNCVVDIPDLENFKMPVTTSVIIDKLVTEEDGSGLPNINQQVAFTLLPWKHLQISTPKRKAKRPKLKNVSFDGLQTGDIFSVRFEGITRGLSRSRSTKYLKNSVTIDLVVSSDKYINIKLSSAKIHMCGPRTPAHSETAKRYVLQHLYTIQDMIDHVRNNPEQSDKAFQWCVQALKGEETPRPVYREMVYQYPKMPSTKFKASSMVEVFRLPDNSLDEARVEQIKCSVLKAMQASADNYMTTENNIVTLTVVYLHEHVPATSINTIDWNSIPEDVDKLCVHYFAFNAPRENYPGWDRQSDYMYYEDWLNEANWLRRYNNVYAKKPINKPGDRKAMVNFNFGLGFNLKRFELAKLFDAHPGFSADFDNMRNQNVMLEVPYYSADPKICRKNKSSAVKLIVYKSGKVTLTGPIEDINHRVFVEFVKYVREIRQQIEVE
jgi:hypothetical protein